jgi:tRNA-dihydrouridine synthase
VIKSKQNSNLMPKKYFIPSSRPFFVLAPMDDVTDTVFRQIIADCAKPDLFVTEFVNVDGLQSPGRPKLLPKLQFTAKEQPIIAQIWGKQPQNYRQTALELVKMGFNGIDINMGCPDKSVVKNGGGSALINNRSLAAEIIAAVKEGADGNVPVSVKLRIGFNEVDFTWPEFILKQGIDMLSVHGRTTKEQSSVPARWEDIAKVREMRDKIAPNTLIVGNGDVTSRQQGEELAKEYKLDGIMVGRGIFANPYIFAKTDTWATLTAVQRIAIFKKHIELFQNTWKDNDKRNYHGLKKFAKVYINGFDGAQNLRTEFVRQQTLPDMVNVLGSFIK